MLAEGSGSKIIKPEEGNEVKLEDVKAMAAGEKAIADFLTKAAEANGEKGE